MRNKNILYVLITIIVFVLILIAGIIFLKLNDEAKENSNTIMESAENSSGLIDNIEGYKKIEPEVTYKDYSVKYNVPNGFEPSEDNCTDSMKVYEDDNNTVIVEIYDRSADSYMRHLEMNTILRYDFYKNQKISKTVKYTVNEKEYNFRTITYDEIDGGSYVNVYFATDLEDKLCYVVEVESKDGKTSMETIKEFLNISILRGITSSDSQNDYAQNEVNEIIENGIKDLFDYAQNAAGEVLEQQEENSNSGKVVIEGVYYDSIEDYINKKPSANQEN